jgi:hypothetical protein
VIVGFETSAQVLMLRMPRRENFEDLNGWWRALEEERESP